VSLAVAQDSRLRNWRWRLNHLYKIADKHGRLITFKENGIQRQINNSKKRRKQILKFRQGGVTTNETLKQLDFAAFSSNKTCVVMADKDENMEKIFSKVRFAHTQMPGRLKPVLATGGGSKYELRFPEINSKIYCALEGRGDTIHWLHISEAAFAKPSRLKATLGAVPPWGIVTWESTPNGLGNHFYRDWITKSQYVDKLFFPWFFHEEYVMDGSRISSLTDEEKLFVAKVKAKYDISITRDQIAFRRAKQEEQKELFIQEYPEDDASCFLASGGAAMDLEVIKRLLDNLKDPIEDTGELKIWKPYDSSRIYACGADTAEGVGGDYSVGSMFDAKTREQVAQIRSNRWRPREFALQLEHLCSLYTKPGRVPPLLGVERNNHGHAVLLELDEHLHYPNLYSFKEDSVGWKTDAVTRPLMIDGFIDGVENETVVLNSRESLGECLTLIDNNGKIEAEEGENDDCIIADAIGIQMCIKAAGDLSVYDDLSDKILL